MDSQKRPRGQCQKFSWWVFLDKPCWSCADNWTNIPDEFCSVCKEHRWLHGQPAKCDFCYRGIKPIEYV